MARHATKIVATLGPASSDPALLEAMIRAGVNVVRLNFSHGKAQDHIDRAHLVREAAARAGREVAIMADLQGPKIRVGKFAEGSTLLENGSTFVLDARCAEGCGERVGLDYPELVEDVKAGDTLLLDDGKIVMQVRKVVNSEIFCEVKVGGVLKNRKGINKLGGGLSAPALTSKDMEDIRTAVAFEADYIAVSFPKSALDIELARTLVKKAGGAASIIAKIERAEAIEALASIIEASDAIMVARGDLGVEVGDAAVPGLQKRMIRMARAHNKQVITATQMMESMISSPIPTRAEVSDVANAVLDGTDAVMLSAETASGQYPLETVEAVHRVVIEAEKEYFSAYHAQKLDQVFIKTDEAVAAAAIYTAQHLKVKAIAALTQSGNAAQWLSRADAEVPIYALSPDKFARRKLTLHRGVYPYPINQADKNKEEILQEMEQVLLQQRAVVSGDLVLLTFGEPIGSPGGTNTLKIIKIGENRPIV